MVLSGRDTENIPSTHRLVIDDYKTAYKNRLFKNKKGLSYCLVLFGADRQTRTADLILTKDVLYHLSHISKPHYLRMLEYYTQGTTLCQHLI